MRKVEAAMVLCAGFGTRLLPLTRDMAKPMLPVGDKPVILHILDRVRLAVPSRIVINVHYRAGDFDKLEGEQGLAISRETELLGTAGGLAHAASMLGKGDVIVWNGDILSDLDPRDLVFAHTSGEASATLAVRPRPAGEGNVGIAADGRIVRLRDQRFGDEARAGEFLGVHVIGQELRNRLVKKGCAIGDVYIPAIDRGERLEAYEVFASYCDIGSLASYLDANLAWLAAHSLREWRAKGAIVKAPIDGSVVGARACIEAPLRRSVAWPGAHVPPGEPLDNVVVTPRSVVRIRTLSKL
ncbi:MAG: sugar phosphate nucleotidyltransferase [Polyangiaceae bacterium]|nr:sugar phosphate nucleotidyltransferase [Polyangiaceae bacterium]